MAKDAKPAKKGNTSNFGRKEHTYGVADIAKLFDVNEATMRGKLRNANVDKDGGSYGWDSKKALDEAADQVREASAGEKTKKPTAKKAVAKKAVAKVKVKEAA